MVFTVSKASNWEYRDEVNIDTLEELIDFINKNDNVVIYKPYDAGDKYSLLIYDSEIEA